MMKKFNMLGLAIIMTIMMSLAPISEAKAATANVGPFKVGRAFCEKIQQISSIMNVYTNVNWNVAGFPGITMGLLSNSSALLDFCQLITNLEMMGTTDALFYTANYLNTLTDKKWGHHLDFMNDAWSLTNTLVDTESGTFRKAALKSPGTHKEINDFMNSTYKWYNKSFNDKDAELKTRGQRESDMEALSRASHQKTLLKEATNCPAAPSDVNYEKIYKDRVAKPQTQAAAYKDDIEFYKGQLLSMGPKFMNNEGQLNDYLKGVDALIVNGVTYSVSEKNKNETTTKKKKKGATVVDEKVTIARKVQTWEAKVQDDSFNDFRTKWSDQWGTWVTAQYLSRGSNGLLMNPKEKVENEFRDLAYECQASRLMAGKNPDSPTYSADQDEAVKKCTEDTQMDQKKANNLFSYYVTKMKDALRGYKANLAIVWNTESQYLGINRAVSQSTSSAANYQQEEVVCQDAFDMLKPASMERIKIQQQNINNELTELSAKQLVQQTAMMKAEKEAQVKQAEEFQRKSQFAEKQNARDKAMLQKTLAPTTIDIKVPRGN